MNKLITLTLTAIFSLAATLLVAAPDPIYPFKVKLGGQTAVKKSSDAIFATVKSPISADASIEVEAQGQVIVNAFQCDKNGNAIQGKTPAILMFQAPKSTLAQTLDGNKLQPGKYLANVVAGGTTSRVIFDIE